MNRVRVKRWISPVGVDLPCLRTEEERDYVQRALSNIDRILRGETRTDHLAYDPREFYGNLTDMVAFREAHRVFCDYDDEVRLRLQNEQAPLRVINIPRDPDIFIGWHNMESHAISGIDQINLYPLVPNDWVSMFEEERFVGAPNPWALVCFGVHFTDVNV